MKGLKDMVAEATADEKAEKPVKPVRVSGSATHAYGKYIRQWSGWTNASLNWGSPTGAPASCDHVNRRFYADIEELLLNPNRVLDTVTPFRLRQEAVLTGALLHEVGHARHTHWKPRTPEAVAAFRHGDGKKVTKQVFALASLMEEPRVEGRVYAEAGEIGAAGLAWTMRASAAALLPPTKPSMDPNQRVMDFITSWALRAGRQHGLNLWTEGAYRMKSWVGVFDSLLYNVLCDHFAPMEGRDQSTASYITKMLRNMIECADDTGTSMIDLARDVCDILFPETDGDADDAPQPGAFCIEQMSSESEGSDESEDSDGGGDGSDESEGEQEQDGKAEDSKAEDSKAEDSDGEGNEPNEDEQKQKQEATLARIEKGADEEASREDPDEKTTGTGSATGGSSGSDGGFRDPSKEEREIGKKAERFLRDLINPTESAKVVNTDQPSANVDPALLAAWRAGGQVREPNFFRRTKREVQPAPPVKIAVLVDVSGSMDVMQQPSMVLSWALASAALDLRNFAGRGVQIESTLIHWGSTARVIQRNGEMLPGIREYLCWEGTWALRPAFDLVEEQIPGFFDSSDKPENRLIVNFTDWEISAGEYGGIHQKFAQGMAAGVNFLSVVPGNYRRNTYTMIEKLLGNTSIQRGKHALVKYDPRFPDQVWANAAQMLG